MRYLEINAADRILIIAPHPDDESIGCGGLLSMFGKQCDVICATDGRQGQGTVETTKLADIRKEEFELVMSFYDVNSYRMLNLEDGKLVNAGEWLKDINVEMYDKIFVTSEYESHPDHVAAYNALLDELKKNNSYKGMCFKYEVHNMMLYPTHMLDISNCIEKKQKAISFYVSQTKNYAFDRLSYYMSAVRGVKLGMHNTFAEAFEQFAFQNTEVSKVNSNEELQKMREYYWIYVRWMRLNQSGYKLSKLLRGKNINSVIIYGFKELGESLERELSCDGIEIKCIIDKIKGGEVNNVAIRKPEEVSDYNTCVIVTPTFYFDEINEYLSKLGFLNVISLKQIVEEWGRHDDNCPV